MSDEVKDELLEEDVEGQRKPPMRSSNFSHEEGAGRKSNRIDLQGEASDDDVEGQFMRMRSS